MSTQSISQKFQTILDARGLKVTGTYVGNFRVAISGLPAEVDRARQLIGCIYTEDNVLDLPADDDLAAERIVWFRVPQADEKNSSRVLHRALARASAQGLI